MKDHARARPQPVKTSAGDAKVLGTIAFESKKVVFLTVHLERDHSVYDQIDPLQLSQSHLTHHRVARQSEPRPGETLRQAFAGGVYPFGYPAGAGRHPEN